VKNIDYSRKKINGIEIKRITNEPQAFKEHLHHELSVGYIEKGSAIVQNKDTKLAFNSGDGLLIPPYFPHMCCPLDIDNWQVIMMFIDDEIFKDTRFEKTDMRILSKTEREDFLHIVELIEQGHIGFELENKIAEFVLCLLHYQNVDEPDDMADKVNMIHSHIKDNFIRTLCLKQLEADFSINKYSLIRSFKQRYNTTPLAFQLQLKTAYSKELLSQGHSLVDVCNRAGFYDQAHFTREFKKSYSITPAGYQSDISN
jgi:AraC-like DNA-binding protein